GTWWQNRGTQRMWAAAAAIAIIVLAGIGLKMLPRGTQQHNQAPSPAIAKKSDQPAVFIVIMPRAIPEIPRIDHASATSQADPTPDNIFAQPPLHRPRDAAHPAPTIQSPVRVMVKNVQFNPDM
ncbi:MAG: hypothetical protein HQ592_05755, partial [Planctomycetes bacterium]|nr:hypothetical protein [Planctomycetota bacterium]